MSIDRVLAAALADTTEKWLISKGKLDYGPFNARQMADQISTNSILPGNIIIDTDSGARKKAEDHPLFGELVEAAKMRRDEQRRTQAEVQHAVSEKRRGAALYIFIGLGVAALGGGVYFLVTKLSASKKDDSGAIVSLEGGTLQAKISFPSKEEQKRRAKASRGHGKSGGVDGQAGGWDDSLNLDMSPDDEDDEGGSGRLSDSDVNPVIAKHGGALGGCLTKTGTHNANIEFMVKPTGKVYQVRVNGQTGSEVSNCVRGVMFRIVERATGTSIALLVSSLFFGLAHLANPDATLFSALIIAIEAGLLLGLAYVVTRNLWFPIGIHFAWNFTEGGIFGASGSSSAQHGLVNMAFSGPDWITGGTLGLDNSTVPVALCIALALTFALRARKHGNWAPMRWRIRLD